MEVPFWLLAHVLDKHEFPAPDRLPRNDLGE
jgi:hypothetical protein